MMMTAIDSSPSAHQVDAGEARPYVSLVKLMLLLSALLSALTGVQAGVRVPQVAVTLSQVVETAVTTRASRTVVAGRPAAAVPALVAERAIARPAWRLAALVPLFASRRRE